MDPIFSLFKGCLVQKCFLRFFSSLFVFIILTFLTSSGFVTAATFWLGVSTRTGLAFGSSVVFGGSGGGGGGGATKKWLVSFLGPMGTAVGSNKSRNTFVQLIAALICHDDLLVQ